MPGSVPGDALVKASDDDAASGRRFFRVRWSGQTRRTIQGNNRRIADSGQPLQDAAEAASRARQVMQAQPAAARVRTVRRCARARAGSRPAARQLFFQRGCHGPGVFGELGKEAFGAGPADRGAVFSAAGALRKRRWQKAGEGAGRRLVVGAGQDTPAGTLRRCVRCGWWGRTALDAAKNFRGRRRAGGRARSSSAPAMGIAVVFVCCNRRLCRFKAGLQTYTLARGWRHRQRVRLSDRIQTFVARHSSAIWIKTRLPPVLLRDAGSSGYW